jgi:hypothetical protein
MSANVGRFENVVEKVWVLPWKELSGQISDRLAMQLFNQICSGTFRVCHPIINLIGGINGSPMPETQSQQP